MVTYVIIGITVLVSMGAFSNQDLFNRLLFNPYVIHSRRQYYRFFTAGFIHADFIHLGFNMYALYLFGGYAERALGLIHPGFGSILFIALYASALVASSLVSYNKHRENPQYNAVGASGAVSAVLFASIIVYPDMKLMIFPIPFFIPSYILGPLYLLYSYYMSNKQMDNIGHDAHLFGALWGILFMLIIWKDAVRNFIGQIF
jgi:membrane associated rhomboid family serine protease